MSSNALVSLNDGTPTRVNRGTGGLSAPDLSIAHSPLLARSEWSTLAPLSSDHIPILSELGLTVQTIADVCVVVVVVDAFVVGQLRPFVFASHQLCLSGLLKIFGDLSCCHFQCRVHPLPHVFFVF